MRLGIFTLLIFAFGPPAYGQVEIRRCGPPSTAGSIRVGQCITSAIGQDDTKNESGTPYEDWRLELDANEAVEIDLDALPGSGPAPPAADGEQAGSPFDAFLEVRRPGQDEPLATNDDRPGSFNSRILFVAPERGAYVIRARPLFVGAGPYSLNVRPARPDPRPAALIPGRTAVLIGATNVRSRFDETWRSALFSFTGVAGERVRFSGVSSRPGIVYTLADASDRLVAQESLGLLTVLPRTGEYRLSVSVPFEGEVVEFELYFERYAAPPPRPPEVVRVGTPVRGMLDLRSGAQLIDGEPRLAEMFELQLREGEAVTVTVRSEYFDPILDAGASTPLGFATALSNDDFGEGVDSRLLLQPTRSGPVQLLVRGVGSGGGAFRLEVAPVVAPDAARSPPNSH